MESNTFDNSDFLNHEDVYGDPETKRIYGQNFQDSFSSDDTTVVTGNSAYSQSNTQFSQLKVSCVSAFDVARYILHKLGSCTSMKLQKLLYFCQAWHLVWSERALFVEEIEAWINGPVVRSVYNFHRGMFILTYENFTNGNEDKLSDDQKESIDVVLDFYGKQDSQWLVNQTHSELPWQEARRGLSPNERGNVKISHEALFNYYSSLK